MQLPAPAVAATALIEVVRVSGLPGRRDAPYPGEVVAHWAGDEVVEVLALIGSLPGSTQHRCGFSPGWGVRAYGDDLGLALFEAAFCFSCDEVRTQGDAVPPALSTQFFDAGAEEAQALLERFRRAVL
ncbi:hypothetical protein IHE56_06555 [Streptomyces sp. ID01-12c]|uniref:Uncharacterized protein n=2 Tax=Streptomyces caniscabiei TaxID=2746961 RepID=A0A927L2X7_9ACTN|nr:hypothetical protein [Streptomyces caniscabiei]MBD9701755.1 hypothetical protein [Streptomyces caniscabiei]MBD9724507.1 hypothetical protein [Streptomyces caniscabiei]MDX3507919.1 hypothetical protein [Streptomyces caniscabiei]MDX3717881.1 hypothetical protein [Streptomyces caniscabiei]MDX3726451.1 hypothetical protein [Streptomyces caniscabiei]